MTNKARQCKMDYKKWIDGVNNASDPCGSYEHCKVCNKEEALPCAKAYNRFYRGIKNVNTRKV